MRARAWGDAAERAPCRAERVRPGHGPPVPLPFPGLTVSSVFAGGKKKPLKQPKKQTKDLDEVRRRASAGGPAAPGGHRWALAWAAFRSNTLFVKRHVVPASF